MRRRQPRRLPAQREPRRIERQYERSLEALAAGVARVTERELAGLVRDYGQVAATRQDQEGATLGQLGMKLIEIISGLRFAFERRISADDWRSRVLRTGKQVDRFNRHSINDQVKSVLGFDVLDLEGYDRAAIDGFMGDNIRLIKSIGDQYLDQVQDVVESAFREGTATETLAKRIAERGSVSESRGRLIARDQIGKLNGRLTERRHQDLGVSHYIWRTSRDSRVRDQHREREGQRYSYAEPPDGGHPGQPVQCRCRAEPDLRSLLEATTGEDWSELQAEGPRSIAEKMRRRGAIKWGLKPWEVKTR